MSPSLRNDQAMVHATTLALVEIRQAPRMWTLDGVREGGGPYNQGHEARYLADEGLEE